MKSWRFLKRFPAVLTTLVIVLALAPPLTTHATEYDDGTWLIEIRSNQTWVPPGGTITYYITVVFLGPGSDNTFMVRDYRDMDRTSGYGAANPPPNSSGANYIEWWGEISAGEMWQATYQVNVNSDPMLVGAKVFNYLTMAPFNFDSLPHTVKIALSNPHTTSAANPSAQTTADPINAATGEHFLPPAVDLNLGGPLPLFFRRTYASGLHDEIASTPIATPTLGSNWMHNLEISMPSVFVTSVMIEGGKIVEFWRAVGGPYGEWSLNNSQEPVRYQLRQRRGSAAQHYWFMDPRTELVYRFDDATGLLQEVLDRNGNRLTVSRDGGGRIAQVSDGLGRTLTYSYTAGLLTRVSDGARHIDFTYTAGNLTSASDPMGHTTTYTYSADLTHGPLLTTLTQPEGNASTTQTYNAAGQAIRQQDAYGHTTVITYGAPTVSQTLVTRPDATTLTFTHADQRLTTLVEDPAGNTVTYTYDIHEQPTIHRDRLGDMTIVTYHRQSGKISSYTDAEDNTTTFAYTAQDQAFVNPIDATDVVTFTFYNLTRVTYADATFETFAYDSRGNVLTTTNRSGEVWAYTTNSRGQLLTALNPAGGLTTLVYNADGTVASVDDSDTGLTALGYDALRRPITITHPGGSTVALAYDLNDQLTRLTDELNRVTTFEYDANGSLITVTNPLTETVGLTRDLMDRIVAATDPLGHAAATSYDEMGRLETVTNRDGFTSTFSYNERGWMSGIRDALDNVWAIAYDDEGVPTAFTTPMGATTHFQSDRLGRTTVVTNPLGAHANFTYDEMGRLATSADYLGRVTAYGYDDDGRLTQVTQPVIGAANYQRNELGLVACITDQRSHAWDFGYTPLGRADVFTDPLGNAWTYDYDTRGRLDQVTYPDATTSDLTYDNAGQITQINYSAGPTLTYTYDDAGQMLTTEHLSLVYDERGSVGNSQDGAASFGATYDAGQRLATATYDGQMVVTYTYDARGLLVGVGDNLSNAWMTFTYDDDSRLMGINRSNGVTTTYGYDGAGRMVRIQDGALADQQYTLNAAGEPTQETRNLPYDPLPPPDLITVTWSYDSANQVVGSGYAYDDLGRQTAAPGRAFAYDGAGRLTQVVSGTATVDLAYNGLGDLRTRDTGGSITTYYHNYALGLAPIVAEQESASPRFWHPDVVAATYERFYVYAPGGALLYSVDPAGGTVRFYHFDRAGSALFLTNPSGSVSDAYAYTPYGRLLGHSGSSDQPFTYVGRYGVRREPVGNLYDMRARAYDPVTVHFLTRDPLWPALDAAQGLNPYQYARQNPLRYIDPTGTDEEDIFQGLPDPTQPTPYRLRDPRIAITPDPETYALQRKLAALESQPLGPTYLIVGGYQIPITLNGLQKLVQALSVDPRIVTTPDIEEWTDRLRVRNMNNWMYRYMEEQSRVRSVSLSASTPRREPTPGKIVTTPDIDEWMRQYRDWQVSTVPVNILRQPQSRPAPGKIVTTPDIDEWMNQYRDWQAYTFALPPTSQRESTTKFNNQIIGPIPAPPTYYWRVDEANTSNGPGPVWRFE